MNIYNFSMNANLHETICHHSYFRCIHELLRVPASYNYDQKHVYGSEDRAADVLHQLEMPSSLSGYQYLHEGLRLMLRDPLHHRNLSRELYPAIARLFDTNIQRVEKNIRCAIDATWRRGNQKLIAQLFPATSQEDGKPSNADFIFTLCEYIAGRPQEFTGRSSSISPR